MTTDQPEGATILRMAAAGGTPLKKPDADPEAPQPEQAWDADARQPTDALPDLAPADPAPDAPGDPAPKPRAGKPKPSRAAKKKAAGPGEKPPPPPIDPDSRLPEGCPIIPLGKEGPGFWYVDANGLIQYLLPRDHGRAGLSGLFGLHNDLLPTYWPRYAQATVTDKDGTERKEWIINGVKADEAADALMAAASAKGIWSNADHVRGRGAWRDSNGRLILHLGNKLLTPDGEIGPSRIEDKIYPAGAALPLPAQDTQDASSAVGSPGNVLLDRLKSWSWHRKDTDPVLLLGWIGAAMLGGALNWRPAVFVTGDAESGKSTLHKLIEAMLGDMLVHAANTTPAGIYQRVGHSALPVAVDELENDQGKSERSRQILELARLSSSGGLLLRGGANHSGSEFRARSCFLFSSILVPPLPPQDLRRLAILTLHTLPAGAKFVVEPRRWEPVGRQVLRRLIDQWPRFDQTLDLYREVLMENGHGQGGADQFGTLLACADLILHDAEPDVETLATWGKRLAADTLAETLATVSDARACLDYLLEAQPESWKGGTKQGVAELCAQIMGHAEAGLANDALAAGGMRLVQRRGLPGWWLAVGTSHRGTQKLYEESRWRGAAGITGPWAQALGRLEGAISNCTQKIGGKATRCTLIPAELLNLTKDNEPTVPAGEVPDVENGEVM